MGTQRWFLYDGDCAFCSASARFLIRRVRADVRVVAWQFADIDALGVTAAECDQAVRWVVVEDNGDRAWAAGPRAIAELLARGGAFWRGLGWLLGSRPGLAVAGPGYRFIARHRDRMPGGTPTCALPAARRNDAGDP